MLILMDILFADSFRFLVVEKNIYQWQWNFFLKRFSPSFGAETNSTFNTRTSQRHSLFFHYETSAHAPPPQPGSAGGEGDRNRGNRRLTGRLFSENHALLAEVHALLGGALVGAVLERDDVLAGSQRLLGEVAGVRFRLAWPHPLPCVAGVRLHLKSRTTTQTVYYFRLCQFQTLPI